MTFGLLLSSNNNRFLSSLILFFLSCYYFNNNNNYTVVRAWNHNHPTPRREAIVDSIRKITTGVSSLAVISGLGDNYVLAATTSISSRMNTDILTIPSPSSASELNGVDNLYYPPWMEGEWDVVQTLVNVSTPLGIKYLGGPNGIESIGRESITEAQTQLDKPVRFQLNYRKTKWGVAEDRLFNTRQRLDAFAGRSVVANVQYADVGVSNRQTLVNLGGTENDPLQTTMTRFKGPAAQKTFVVSHGIEKDNNTTNTNHWVGYELDRSIFALTNSNTAPPLTTDSELVWDITRIDDTSLKANLRLAGYLNAQSDTLYFDARQRAVSLQDYTLVYTKKQE